MTRKITLGRERPLTLAVGRARNRFPYWEHIQLSIPRQRAEAVLGLREQRCPV